MAKWIKWTRQPLQFDISADSSVEVGSAKHFTYPRETFFGFEWYSAPASRRQYCLSQLTTPENTITYHNALCLSPKNFSISIAFSFSWELKWPQEELKTMLMQNFGVTNEEHYGMLWYFLEWSIHYFTLTIVHLVYLQNILHKCCFQVPLGAL